MTMRATEVCSVQVKDFDISTDTFYLHWERLKGSRIPCPVAYA